LKGGSLWEDLHKNGIDVDHESAFVEFAKLLYSPRHRNLTAARFLAEKHRDNSNVAFLESVLFGAWDRNGIADNDATLHRLQDCAWRGINSLCHMALGYRRLDDLILNYLCCCISSITCVERMLQMRICLLHKQSWQFCVVNMQHTAVGSGRLHSVLES
jgi:hypothetical protein